MPKSTTISKAQPPAVALFVSDVHLKPSLPKTTAAFFHFLQQYSTQAQQLYILGDLFEYWAGDDDMADPYYAKVVSELRAVGNKNTELFWIAGNRDFLVGPAFAAATGAILLEDPSACEIAGRSIVLAHGDAQCTDDLPYIAFRAQVRQPQWQAQFLAKPLAERKAIIEGLRQGSKEEQKNKSMAIMDVNPQAIDRLFADSNAACLIHGHTHRPASHRHAGGVRHVLPDWDYDTDLARGGWLALCEDGQIWRSDMDGQYRISSAPASPAQE
jgi:UDP-2,3-diacylglucosamine hydrolase